MDGAHWHRRTAFPINEASRIGTGEENPEIER
jgi:hypothetical protein